MARKIGSKNRKPNGAHFLGASPTTPVENPHVVTTTKSETVSLVPSVKIEVKEQLATLSLDTGREETNTIVAKINEIITWINQH